MDLDEDCSVKVANRAALVRPDGTFSIRNIAIFFTQETGVLPELYRVRATCLRNGELVQGQSDFFTLRPNETTFVTDVFPAELAPIPSRITLSAPQTELAFGESMQLTVIAHYADGTTADVSSRAAGTTFITTSPRYVTVTEDGLLNGVSNRARARRVGVTAIHEGNVANLRITATAPTEDLDADGMPNDWEDLFGLDRLTNDAAANLDGDGLTNLEEFLAGTLPNHVDTDLDTLLDGFDNDPLRFDDEEPLITFTSPQDGESFLELQDVPVVFSVDDNETLAAVQLHRDGLLIFDRATPPFEHTFTMPRAVAGADLEITATDTVGNVATAARFVPAVLDAPPVVDLTIPAAGQVLGEGATVAVTAEVSDDIDVLDVVFTLDGTARPPVFTPPYSVTYQVPMGATDLDITVVASDRIQTTTVQRTVTVSEDPMTTVIGRTLDAAGQPVEGALAVTNFGDFGSGDINGDFSIDGVPTLQGEIEVVATANVFGGDLSGRSGLFAPVAGSFTDVGDITLRLRPALYPGRRYTTGEHPHDLDIADFDGDGIDDLVVANRDSADLSILLGQGNGNYADAISLPSCDKPWEVIAVDLNGDTFPDAVATCSLDLGDSISVHLNNGLGAFAAETLVPVGAWPSGLASGDFDADGHMDLAVTLRAADVVTVLPGLGDGTFGTAVQLPTEAAPTRIESADLDSDGDLDLALIHFDGQSLGVLSNQGDGTFSAAVTVAVPEVRPAYLALGDLDEDGLIDAVCGHIANGGKLSRWKGTGSSFLFDGLVEPGTTTTAIPVLADIDLDGHLDLMVTDQGADPRGFFLQGNGDGSLATPAAVIVGAASSGLAPWDIDDDGDVDLLSLQTSTDNVLVTYGIAPGEFNQPLVFAAGDTPIDLAAADFDLDGHLDIATTDRAGHTVSIFLGQGDGTLQLSSQLPVDPQPLDIVPMDFNEDGALDLVVANQLSDSLSLLSGQGDGTFQIQTLPSVGNPRKLAVGDFNSDGHGDLMVISTSADDQVGFHLGDGVTFGAFQLLAPIDDPTGLVVADFDADGKVDLAVTSYQGDDLAVFLGHGDGTFQAGVLFADGKNTRDLAAADLDLDGHLDLVAGNTNLTPTTIGGITIDAPNGTTSVLFGHGDGTFTAPLHLPTGEFSEGVALGDINQDGIPDIVVGSGPEAVIAIGNGDRTFRPLQRYTQGRSSATALGDFNGDGLIDLAMPGADTDDLWILLQQ